jgi:hypothetical protein
MDYFFQLDKADFKGEFEGVMACLERDLDGEIINWPGTKKAVAEWSTGMADVSGGKNFGNIRDQHSNMVIGKLTEPPAIDEKNKRIKVKGMVVDPVAKEKLQEGLYTGLSIGGAYASKKPLHDGTVEYIPRLGELSLCDKPCSPSALLTVTRADGSTLQKRFRPPLEPWKRVMLGKMLMLRVAHELAKADAAGTTSTYRKSRVNPNVAAANTAFPGMATQGGG